MYNSHKEIKNIFLNSSKKILIDPALNSSSKIFKTMYREKKIKFVTHFIRQILQDFIKEWLASIPKFYTSEPVNTLNIF